MHKEPHGLATGSSTQADDGQNRRNEEWRMVDPDRSGPMSVPSDGYVLGFEEIDLTQVAVVGGKGAQLAELSRVDGIQVPAGYCVTTAAFRRVTSDAASIDDQLDRLSRLDPDDRDAIRTLSAEIEVSESTAR